MPTATSFKHVTAFLASDQKWYVRLYREGEGSNGSPHLTFGPYERYVDLAADILERYRLTVAERDMTSAAQLLTGEPGNCPLPPKDCIPGAKAKGVQVHIEEADVPVDDSDLRWFATEEEVQRWMLKHGDPATHSGHVFVVGDPRMAFPKDEAEEEMLSRVVALQIALDTYEDRLFLRAQARGHRLSMCPNCLATYSPRQVSALRCPKCNARRRLEEPDDREARQECIEALVELQEEIDALHAEPHRPHLVVARISYLRV